MTPLVERGRHSTLHTSPPWLLLAISDLETNGPSAKQLSLNLDLVQNFLILGAIQNWKPFETPDE